MLKRYGLTALTNNTREGNLHPAVDLTQIEGDMIAWCADYSYGDPDCDMMMMNLTSGKFIPVMVGNTTHTTRFGLSDGRLAFTRATLSPDGLLGADYPYLYDAHNGSLRRIDTGLSGEAVVESFHQGWVAVRTRGNRDVHENGIWAVNVDDGRRVQLWERPAARTVNNVSEYPSEVTIRNGHAYGGITRDDDRDFSHVTKLYDWDLENQSREILVEDAGEIGRIASSDRYIAWETGGVSILGYDRQMRQELAIANWTIQPAGFPSAGGDWVTFWSSTAKRDDPMGQGGGFIAMHLPTGSRVQLLPFDGGTILNKVDGTFSATDGKLSVLAVRTADPAAFQRVSMDLYIRELPDP